jgi:HEAT repeat protein
MLVKRSDKSAPDAETPAQARDIDQVLHDLDAAEGATRRRAAQDLGANKLGANALGAPALCRRLAIEKAPSVRAVILTSLIRLRSPEVVDELVDFLRSDDAALRNAVIEALQDMPDEVLPALDRLLDDDDSDLRIFAVNIMNELRHHDVRSRLARVIADDPHVNVCMAAIDGVVEIGDESLIAPLELLEQRFPDAPFVKFAVAAAILRLRGAR